MTKSLKTFTEKTYNTATMRYSLPDLPLVQPIKDNMKKFNYYDAYGNPLTGIVAINTRWGMIIKTVLNGVTHSFDDLPSHRAICLINYLDKKADPIYEETYQWHKHGRRHRFNDYAWLVYRGNTVVKQTNFYFDYLVPAIDEQIYFDKTFLEWHKTNGIDLYNLSEEDKTLMNLKWNNFK